MPALINLAANKALRELDREKYPLAFASLAGEKRRRKNREETSFCTLVLFITYSGPPAESTSCENALYAHTQNAYTWKI